MAPRRSHPPLAKRERQILDALYRLGRATAGEVREALGDKAADSTIRTQLRVLEDKGHVRHEMDGARYVYEPTVPREAARRSALRHLIDTFFEGSSAQAVTALLGGDVERLSHDDLKRIETMVTTARRGKR